MNQIKIKPSGHIIFDHDGTLVNTDISPYTLFVGMRELLIDLKAHDFELYIWTSRPRRSVIETIGRLDIAHFFTDIFCFDDGLPKPNPMGLQKLTEGIDKKEILHIGDSYTDIDGAQAYGIEVVAACWNSPDQVDKYEDIADYTALDLNQCREIIKGKFYV
ncbi:MAG: HAD family hydrolase [Bacteriovorax sp.]|nr:HAD family hydrolase [Bacteriovorax sp.]